MRALFAAVAAVPLVLMHTPANRAQPVCKPSIAFSEAHYAPMTLPKLERTWTVAFTVDASPCAAGSGSFSILFTMWKENALDTEYVETFQWVSGANVISKAFWADEAVGGYKINDIAPCACRKN